jgi:translation elongation factor EF-1beta
VFCFSEFYSYIYLTSGTKGGNAAPAVPSSGAKKAAAATPAAAPAAKKEENFDDMFGGDDEEELDEEGENAAEQAATKARKERMELALKLKEEKDAKDGKVKGDKAKPVEKSLLVLDVKPWEADTDLEAVWHLIKEYKQEGLAWGETFKLEPVAYGIKKLVMTCTIVDSLVLMDDITENIEALEEHVQSCTVASMNKI